MDYEQLIKDTEKALLEAARVSSEMRQKVVDMLKRLSSSLGIEKPVEIDATIESYLSDMYAIVFENLKSRIQQDTQKRSSSKPSIR